MYVLWIIRSNKNDQAYSTIFQGNTQHVFEISANTELHDYCLCWRRLGRRQLTTGFLLEVHGNPVCWVTRKQSTVALSSTEAEYVALVSASTDHMNKKFSSRAWKETRKTNHCVMKTIKVVYIYWVNGNTKDWNT